MKRDWWDKEFRVLMTLGESTTAAGGSSCRQRCWPSQLARLIKELEETIPRWRNESVLQGGR